MPQNLQVVAMPHLLSLMDLPDKDEIIKAVRDAGAQETPEQIDKRIAEAVKQALANAAVELKAREIAVKERKADSEVREIDAKSVQIGVMAAYSAMQAGAQVAQMPMIAPIADAVMQGAGYNRPSPVGDDPNFPTAGGLPADPGPAPVGGSGGAEADPGVAEVQQNTSPAYPPVPQEPSGAMTGIETPAVTDNIEGAPA
jgi:hypothetical protein